MIEYDEYDLLELFDLESKIFWNEDKEAFKYEHSQKNGWRIEFFMSPLSNMCRIVIWFKENTDPITNIHCTSIEKVLCRNKENKLIIVKKDNPKKLIVLFKPQYVIGFAEILLT